MTLQTSATVIQGAAASPPAPVPGSKVEHGCFATPSLWYYDVVSFNSQSPGIYGHLVSNAQTKVQVWDPYLFAGDAPIFVGIRPGVALHVLTSEGCIPHAVPKCTAFKSAVGPYVSQALLDIRFHNRRTGVNDPFHDRYLIADGIAYKVGASLNYHRGDKPSSHGIVRIPDEVARNLIQNRFQFWWDHHFTEKLP